MGGAEPRHSLLSMSYFLTLPFVVLQDSGDIRPLAAAGRPATLARNNRISKLYYHNSLFTLIGNPYHLKRVSLIQRISNQTQVFRSSKRPFRNKRDVVISYLCQSLHCVLEEKKHTIPKQNSI